MSDIANSVRALRQFYKDRTEVPDRNELEAELRNSNDRSVVITLAAFLDDALEFVVAKRLQLKTKEDFDSVFRFEGPLGSFASCTEIAFLFNVIDATIHEQLNDIREMRNACAHSKRTISFKTIELANVAKRLFHPKGVFRLQGDTPDLIRGAFIAECLFLFVVLAQGRDVAERQLDEVYKKAGKPSPLR